MSSVRVGFIGVGAMGSPMAARLAAQGHQVTVFDVRPETARQLAAHAGLSAAANLQEALARQDLVITMLRRSEDVYTALADAVARRVLTSGCTVIDMTSGSPDLTRKIAALLQEQGVTMLDAPVSGGVKGAREGTLTLMVGGTQADYARWSDFLLRSFGSKIFHVGPIGAGQAVKALNNLVSAAGLTAAAEAVIIGKRFGLDPEQMIDIFNVSSGRNHGTETKFKSAILPGTYAGGFRFDLMLKDITIALRLAEQTHTPAELGRACVDMWARAQQELSEDADSTEISRWIESAAARAGQA